MALRTYWCVLSRKRTGFFGGTVFREIDRFSYDLDLEGGPGFTIRAALLTGIRQNGGEEADVSEYRLDILDPEDGQVRVPNYATSPEAAVCRVPDSLADYTDDQLISELARRLRNR